MTAERRMPLSYLLEHWRPGSGDWSWDDERDDLDSRVCVCCDQPGHYQQQLEAALAAIGGIPSGVCLGTDGRVWDGHHRIVAARRLGFADVPLEDVSDPVGEPWLADRITVGAS